MVRLYGVVLTLSLAALGFVLVSPERADAATCPAGNAAISAMSFTVGATTSASLQVSQGQRVTATFTIAPGCENAAVAFASYSAPAPFASLTNIGAQALFDAASATFSAGTHSLTVNVPMCFFQVDLYRGPVVSVWDQNVLAVFLGPQTPLLAYANGGDSPCSTVVGPTATLTPSATPTPTGAGVGGVATPAPSSAPPSQVGYLPSTSTRSTEDPLAPLVIALIAVAGVFGTAGRIRRMIRDR